MRGSTRNRLLLLLLVGATAAVLVVPFALRGDDNREPASDPKPEPVQTSVSETAEPSESSESPSELDDMVVLDRQQADVDADKQPDEVRLLRVRTDAEQAEGAVQVLLANGESGTAPVRLGYFDLRPPIDINRDGRQQLLVMHTQGGDGAVLLAYAWQDGSLVALRDDPDAPLGLENNDSYRSVDYYVNEGRLFSWARRDPLDPRGPLVVSVDTWSWSVDGDRLVGTPAGPACVDLMSYDPPKACA